MFNRLEGDTVLLKTQAGKFTPADLYTFQGGLFARVSGGYARLKKDGTTSMDGVSFVYIETNLDLYADAFGRISVEPRPGMKALAMNVSGETVAIEYKNEG